ncbi:hypothetical protein [Rhodovulum sp. MB263]|uniref:hypothetical protein n=1 Tax=Rhodovulum sp. (strain MB263) TaxID=308754 RepID=UPI0009B71B21|nr:hypothetical protein [Rhodovulum sp. MB263]ARC87859.1 hypothetical protein B5V46_04115 [Rhodovulum sp. MB263]
MQAFEDFLAAVAGVDLSPAFVQDDRPGLIVDTQSAAAGISLVKASERNVLGVRQSSVIAMVLNENLPLHGAELAHFASLADLVRGCSWKVEDASPDSVTGVLFLAARLSGVSLPDAVRDQWLPAISGWERTGVVDRPEERSWPALAAALSHSVLGDRSVGVVRHGSFCRAWQMTMGFAVEALRAGWDPAEIPVSADGSYLAQARAALEEERARYERKLYAQQVHQLSLPMKECGRRRLVDAIVTSESEFTGSLKVFARNDRTHAPLGRGFTVLVIVRPGIKETEPGNWVTVSVDTRAGVHLLDFWREIERMETAEWDRQAVRRPPRTKDSRLLVGLPEHEQKYHQTWYIAPGHSLVASPHAVSRIAGSASAGEQVPSQLKLDAVLEALFRIYDPFALVPVTDLEDGTLKRLPDVKTSRRTGGKHVLSACWSREDPLPHPASPAKLCGLFPTAARVMGARTYGVSPERAMQDAPDLEDVDLVSFGQGIAVLTDGGVFLLDSGRRRAARLDVAVEMVRTLSDLADRLDKMQAEVAKRAEEQAKELESRARIRTWLAHQRFCTCLNAELIRIRGSLDQPLETKLAGLQPLSDAISLRWNIRPRLRELTNEIEALQQNGRAAEELRAFRAGRWAAALALALVTADALAGRVTHALEASTFSWVYYALAYLGDWLEVTVFMAIFCGAVALIFLASIGLRGTPAPSANR